MGSVEVGIAVGEGGLGMEIALHLAVVCLQHTLCLGEGVEGGAAGVVYSTR